jgi:hypothetical protein
MEKVQQLMLLLSGELSAVKSNCDSNLNQEHFVNLHEK